MKYRAVFECIIEGEDIGRIGGACQNAVIELGAVFGVLDNDLHRPRCIALGAEQELGRIAIASETPANAVDDRPILPLGMAF